MTVGMSRRVAGERAGNRDVREIKVKVTKYADRRNFVMYYLDPVTEKQITKSTGKRTRRAAERVAALWEVELRSGRKEGNPRMTWKGFREKYESEKLASLSQRTREATDTAFNHLENLIAPARLAALDEATISVFQAKLRRRKIQETSIASYLRHLKAALNWAVSMALMPFMPKIHMPKRSKGQRMMRGRPITPEEYEKMIKTVPEVRPHDAAAWQHYLQGLWLSGLRLEESLILSWDEDAPISIDLTGRRPRLRIYAEAEKGNRDRLLPMTPDFAAFLLATPESDCHGLVFNLDGQWTRTPMTPRRVGRVVSAIGKKADVVVNKGVHKFASAHDFRRAFGTRWAKLVMPSVLQKLMRHDSIETTLRYYVDLDADEMAEELWRMSGSINTFINTPSLEHKKEEKEPGP
jgi:integrase